MAVQSGTQTGTRGSRLTQTELRARTVWRSTTPMASGMTSPVVDRMVTFARYCKVSAKLEVSTGGF